jgi:hypothetical protein
LDAPDRLVPLRLSELICFAGSITNGQRGKGREGSPRLGFQRGHGREADDGDALVALGDEKVVDEVRLDEGRAMECSTDLIASCNDAEWRLKKLQPVATLVMDECVVLELPKTNRKHEEVRTEEGDRLVPKRGGTIPHGHTKQARIVADMRSSDE